MRYSCLKSAAHDSQENFQDLPDDREAPTPSDDEPEDHPTLTDRVRATPTPKPSSIPPLWNDGGLPVKEEVLENDRVFGLAMDPVEQKCLFGLDKKTKLAMPRLKRHVQRLKKQVQQRQEQKWQKHRIRPALRSKKRKQRGDSGSKPG